MLKSLGLWKTTEEAIIPNEEEGEIDQRRGSTLTGSIKNKSKSVFQTIKDFIHKKYDSKNTLTSEIDEDETSSTINGGRPSVSSVINKEEKTVVIRYPAEDPCEYFPQIIPLS